MKKYKNLFTLLSLFFVLALGSCSKYDMPNGDGRTILIYISGNNTLSSIADQNLKSLKSGYIPSEKSSNILLVVVHNRENTPKLLRLYKDGNGNVVEDMVADYAGRSSVDPKLLNEVMLKIKAIFNPKDFGVVFWSHATGWLPKNAYKVRSTYLADKLADPYAYLVKSFGDDHGGEMDIMEMANAIPYKLSFAIFDCCFMGGVEVAYQMKDKAKYIIASPTEILASGFPYEKIMVSLFKTEPDLTAVCESFYNYYVNQAREESRSATISLYDLSEIEALATKCREVFSLHGDKISDVQMDKIQAYFRFNDRYFYDMGDFIKQLDPVNYNAFKAILDKVVIAKWHTPLFLGLKIESYSGISIYIPAVKNPLLENYYRLLQWNKQVCMIY